MEILNLVTKQYDDVLHVSCKGYIDTETSEQFKNYIEELHEKNPNTKIVIDFAHVTMITSAGIRCLLLFTKNNINFELTNINKEVYTVLSLSGMDSILNIKQETYSINTEGCKLLGKGFHSEVYRLDDETIAKVYYNVPTIDMPIRERMIAKQAFIKGVPTEISFALCTANGKPGLIYELVDSDTLLSIFVNDETKIKEYLKDYVNLIKTMHTFNGDGITGIYDKKVVFAEELETTRKYIPEEYYQKIKDIGDAIPASNMLLHGDPHPANIMLTKRGMIFIDLSDMGIGDEKFDLMYLYRTLILFQSLPNNQYALSVENSKLLWDLFVEEYYKDKDPEYIEQELYIIKILALNSIVSKFCYEKPNSDNAKFLIDWLIKEIDNKA